jgi:hypothetical protein
VRRWSTTGGGGGADRDDVHLDEDIGEAASHGGPDRVGHGKPACVDLVEGREVLVEVLAALG